MQNSPFFQQIRERLTPHAATGAPDPTTDPRPAAVALILRENLADHELLFIERARHPGDPWSGNIGFPGGRHDLEDLSLKFTAERETREEVGIDLHDASYLGRLSDIVGANLPVRVSCFVYGLTRPVKPVLERSEVNDLFWFGLQELWQERRQVTARFDFDDRQVEAPAIDLGLPGKPLLWGITYRLVAQFRMVLESDGRGELPPELYL